MVSLRSLSGPVLTCPLCSASVPARASSCRECHLPISDVRRHGIEAADQGAPVHSRLLGVAIYAAVIGWCVWQLPTALAFVGPAAAAGMVLHGIKGRPWLGLAAFLAVLVLLPGLLMPAVRTGAFSDLADWITGRPW